MTILEYKEYLHEEWEDIQGDIKHQLGIEISDEVRDKLGRPFYEVEVSVGIDTDTGEVWATHFCGVELTTPVVLNKPQ